MKSYKQTLTCVKFRLYLKAKLTNLARNYGLWALAVCTNVDQNLIADQRNFRAKYLQSGKEN